MARINIDDELHAEKGFKRLVRMLGDEDKAIGMLYRFWHSAQDYWGDECGLMPKEEFEADGFRPIMEVGLAEERSEGIYASGAEERFAWYLQKCRASKKAVKARLGEPETDSGQPGKSAGESKGSSERVRRSTGDSPPNNPTASVPVPVTSTVTALTPATVAGSSEPGVGDFKNQVREASNAWLDCLKRHGAEREMFPWEEVDLARNIQSRGFQAVLLAILGQKYEPESPEFKPSRHLSLKRLFDPQKFDRFVNLGAQARKKLAEREQEEVRHAEREAIANEPPPDPVEVRKFLNGLFGEMPKGESA